MPTYVFRNKAPIKPSKALTKDALDIDATCFLPIQGGIRMIQLTSSGFPEWMTLPTSDHNWIPDGYPLELSRISIGRPKDILVLLGVVGVSQSVFEFSITIGSCSFRPCRSNLNAVFNIRVLDRLSSYLSQWFVDFLVAMVFQKGTNLYRIPGTMWRLSATTRMIERIWQNSVSCVQFLLIDQKEFCEKWLTVMNVLLFSTPPPIVTVKDFDARL